MPNNSICLGRAAERVLCLWNAVRSYAGQDGYRSQAEVNKRQDVNLATGMSAQPLRNVRKSRMKRETEPLQDQTFTYWKANDRFC